MSVFRRFGLCVMAVGLLWPVTAELAGIGRLRVSDYKPGVYAIDQRFGVIGFAVNHLGLFSSEGGFKAFSADLVIDGTSLERTAIDVRIDAATVDMAWKAAGEMLLSPEYFDAAGHPRIHFRSTDITVLGADRYTVSGLLDLRGVTQPVTLEAVLLGEREEPGNTVGADFLVTGRIDRTRFGMVADRTFISDEVDLRIKVRVGLMKAARGG